MNANDVASDRLVRDSARTLDSVAGLVALICHGEDDAATEELEERLIAGRAAVRGNRQDWQPTYADLRYCFAADLRVLLDELENHI